MILHEWGVLPYEQARQKMEAVHLAASADGQNHLILTQHTPCHTVGRDAWDLEWPFPVVRTDRGGSVTCHSPGQNIYYFIFQAPNPPLFFKKVKTVFGDFFAQFDRAFYYDRENPGFYIQNRKICSLGFRYRNGVSLHGVSLNVDVDPVFHNRINPCGLQGIVATSLKQEGIEMRCAEVDRWIVGKVEEVFDESL